MVDRYFRLFEFLDVEDDVLELLPSPAVNKRLRLLLQELRDIESATKALQGSDVDLLDVREWFDELITAKLQYAHYLGKSDRLTRAEKAALHPFAVEQVATTDDDAEEPEATSLVERLRYRRRLAKDCAEYDQLKIIPPTSNAVERFFSVTRVTFGHQRHSMLPLTLETILFLRENSSYWDASTVDSLQ
ncbi:hypothetical protein PHMEG_00023953 [Phytophthora megakarya]|uniref:HAT C-terminal dimerisation domain-containing protein n=1 Tax=Phytophthora megakarya TaxID=4795 RepID=A0A225VFL5_9STRA|nr:hypothetical protein PHMEG_00023953 [Phytophthora megakarya]